MDPSRYHQASDIRGSSQLMSTKTGGAGVSSKVWSPWNKLEESDLSPVVLEIFTPLRSSDYGEMEQELRTLQQSQARHGVSGTSRVIALVYRVPTLLLDNSSEEMTAVPHLLCNPAWFRRQKEYAVKTGQNIIINTPQIIVQGSAFPKNFRSLPDFTKSALRYLCLGIKDAKYAFWTREGIRSIEISFTLDLRSKRIIPDMKVMIALYEMDEVVCDCGAGSANTAMDLTKKFIVKDLIEAATIDIKCWVEVFPVRCDSLLKEEFTKNHFGILVFLQYQMQVYGAQSFFGCPRPSPAGQNFFIHEDLVNSSLRSSATTSLDTADSGKFCQ